MNPRPLDYCSREAGPIGNWLYEIEISESPCYYGTCVVPTYGYRWYARVYLFANRRARERVSTGEANTLAEADQQARDSVQSMRFELDMRHE